MKLICDRQMMSEALGAATAVIAARSPKPILECIRITAETDALVLTAYDQEVGIRYRVTHVEVSKTGETLVKADRLAAIVRESSDESLTLEQKDDLLHVRGEDSHFQIYGQSVREFPPVPDFEGEPDFRVKAGVLEGAINRTIFAAARESTRYAINGVLWERKGKKLQLIATDGRRLSWTSIPLEDAVGESGGDGVIVPVKTLGILARLKGDAADLIDVKIQPNQILLRTPRATISSVLVEGHFPNYDQVIPSETTRHAELDTEVLHSAVRRAALLTNEESRGVRLSFSADGLVLSARAPEQGEATIHVQARVEGGDIEIGFNPHYLIEALKVCGEKVTIEMTEPAKPGVLKSGTDFLYVVMPVTLS
ncbi:MAG: DNA polymerase III subunit beta [Phycisphaerae bacterium]